MNFLDPASLSDQPDEHDGQRDQAAALALHYLDGIGAIRRHQDFVLQGRVTLVEGHLATVRRVPAKAPGAGRTSEGGPTAR